MIMQGGIYILYIIHCQYTEKKSNKEINQFATVTGKLSVLFYWIYKYI